VPYFWRRHGWIRTRHGILDHFGKTSHKDRLLVSEQRVSIALKTTCDLELPIFTLVLLTDGSVRFSRDLADLDSTDGWKESGIRPAIRQTGISAMAFRIHEICSEWAKNWGYLLGEFDRQLNVEVGAPGV
jgi:hypothetical protein